MKDIHDIVVQRVKLDADGYNQTVVANFEKCQDIFCCSPDGWEFGYGGSGPTQLAFDILFYFTRNFDFSYYAKHLLVRDVISQEKSNTLIISKTKLLVCLLAYTKEYQDKVKTIKQHDKKGDD